MITARGSDGRLLLLASIAKFLFLHQHNNSWTTALSLMEFCMKCTLTSS